jgi:hypothetical protein
MEVATLTAEHTSSPNCTLAPDVPDTLADGALAFLKALWGGSERGYLVQSTYQPTDTYWHGVDDLDGAAAAAVRLGRSASWYVGMGLQPAILPDKQRGAADTVIGIPGAWMELDWRDSAHKKQNLPPNREAVRALLSEFGCPPSIIIDSGHGFHVHWLFPEVWQWEDGDQEQRDAAAALVLAVQTAIKHLAAKHGWTDVDSTHDLARVLRIPGTYNHKDTKHGGDPLLVQTADWHPERRYRRAELLATAQAVTPPEPAQTVRARATGPQPVETADGVVLEEHEQTAVLLIAGSWPRKPKNGSPGPSRHDDFLMPLLGALTERLAADVAAAVVIQAAEQADDTEFLARDYQSEIKRLARDSYKKRWPQQPSTAPKKFKGWPALAEKFPPLAAALRRLYPPPEFEVPSEDGDQSPPELNARLLALQAALDQERAAHAELRKEHAAVLEELRELRRQDPQGALRRLARSIGELESDGSTRGMAWPLLTVLMERQELMANKQPGDTPIPWKTDERCDQLGRSEGTLRLKFIKPLEDADIIRRQYHERGAGAADGNWCRDLRLQVVADLPDDLADQVQHIYRRVKQPKPPRKVRSRGGPCETCLTAACKEHPEAPVRKEVRIYCTECQTDVVEAHTHQPQRPSKRPPPAITFLSVVRSVPPVARKFCGQEDEERRTAKFAGMPAAGTVDGVLAELERLHELSTHLPPAYAAQFKVWAMTALQAKAGIPIAAGAAE